MDADLSSGRWLAYGNGRSYGDSCFPSEGALIDMRRMNRILAFDELTGRVRVEPGVILGDLIRHTAPAGWFPAVVPGTQFVTIGGAVANDIHGKNHHRHGTFGRHVVSLRLMRSDGRLLTCGPESHAEMFAATVGGLGLTGLIVEIELQLMRVGSTDIVQEAVAIENLGAFFAKAPEREARHDYVVAWLDSLASGRNLGRGVLLCGDHAPGGPSSALRATPRVGVPFTPPFGVINRPALTVFNALYRSRALAAAGPSRVGAGAFFFPLDAVGGWNRLYGPRGLRQHQSVIPLEAAEATIARMLERTQRAGHGSFLTVLKLFGSLPSPGVLSFPMPGATLTLDFPHRGIATDALLAALDDDVVAAGGRVNPYKDARMSAATFHASFPQARPFQASMDPAASSAFAVRVGLMAAPPSQVLPAVA